MKIEWKFPDVQLYSLSDATYETIALNWRDSLREELIEVLADELSNCSSCLKWAVTDTLDMLPDIWRSERTILAPILMERIKSQEIS